MAMINYADKVALNQNSNIADINKVKADDMNELKNAFNNQVSQGWYKTGISPIFTFVSFDSTTKTGIVTSNVDLTSYLNVGMKVKFTQNSAIKYAFITAITSTQLTLFLGTDYSINNSAISNTYYSMLKAPYGFPMQKAKWRLIKSYASDAIQSSAVAGIWYNLGSVYLDVPVGAWDLEYKVTAQNGSSVQASVNRVITATLSTTNNGTTNPEYNMQIGIIGNYIRNTFQACENKIIASTTRWYLNTMSDTAVDIIYNLGAGKPTQIIAVCAYL